MSIKNYDLHNYKNMLLSNKDDLYNLSVRKKAAKLCVILLSSLNKLDICYNKLTDKDENIESYLKDNNQIKLIFKNILKSINTKTKLPEIIKELEIKGNIRLYICALLTEIADNTVALSNIMSIRHIERELIYVSEIILKQLIYILPYKLNQ